MKSISNESNINNSKKLGFYPYLLACMSFIPLAGVAIGIIAIILGIKTFKRGGNRLIVIALLGISSTFLILTSYYYTYEEFLKICKFNTPRNFFGFYFCNIPTILFIWFFIKMSFVSPKNIRVMIAFVSLTAFLLFVFHFIATRIR